MLTLLKNAWDKSGQSGQARKYWGPSIPSRLSRVSRNRDKLPMRVPSRLPVPIAFELDCAPETTRPMSWPERTATD